jgi:hypothetical protein
VLHPASEAILGPAEETIREVGTAYHLEGSHLGVGRACRSGGSLEEEDHSVGMEETAYHDHLATEASYQAPEAARLASQMVGAYPAILENC